MSGAYRNLFFKSQPQYIIILLPRYDTNNFSLFKLSAFLIADSRPSWGDKHSRLVTHFFYVIPFPLKVLSKILPQSCVSDFIFDRLKP